MSTKRRSPSPMFLSSPDPADFSSSEEGEASMAAVTSSKVEELSDLENGRKDLPPELSPIPVDVAKMGVRACRCSVHRGVSGFGTSVRDASGVGRVCEAVKDGVDGGVVEDDGDDGGAALTGDGEVAALSIAPGVSCGAVGDTQIPTMNFDGVVGLAVDSEILSHFPTSSIDDGIEGVQPMAIPMLRATTMLFGSRVSVSLDGGGMVSEEGRVLPVAREALRPQPTDGLRQPSSVPVEPVSGVSGGGGHDGCFGGRSYAHVVQQLTIGRRSSPRKKQVHGPQNPLDGEAHTEEAAEIAERRVHERGRSQYYNQNQLIGELLQEAQTL
ncbi:hypothetical protein Dimus_024721 [Dionaea muscipula]